MPPDINEQAEELKAKVYIRSQGRLSSFIESSQEWLLLLVANRDDLIYLEARVAKFADGIW